MKLKDARDNYYYFTQKTSEIVRQLGFAGIAIVWIFKVEADGKKAIPLELTRPAWLIVLGLIIDFLHYAVASVVWGAYNRYKEKSGIDEETEFLAFPQINWPTNFLFWAKIVVMAIAYFYLLRFLITKVT